ncbi:hypothetical protein DFH08DRAFT_991829 [Mycena albidolilacea]|uniref:RING-type domain-containing protein n=1 Tax=Mycena albidolilacea TaxID=1033008 RepID=A0AAD6Z038_9AGAR|nr:hypothetical protein DFH08DRAFT_991829 [Mycena albidolilacea]
MWVPDSEIEGFERLFGLTAQVALLEAPGHSLSHVVPQVVHKTPAIRDLIWVSPRSVEPARSDTCEEGEKKGASAFAGFLSANAVMRKLEGQLSQAVDDSLPSPLTSRNLKPRSEARSLRSASSSRSRGGSARPSGMPPTNAVASGSSSRKRQRSGSPVLLGSKKKRTRATVEDEQEEVDELSDDVPLESALGLKAMAEEEKEEVDELQNDQVALESAQTSDPSGSSRGVEISGQEDEVESILLRNAQDASFDSSRHVESPPERPPVSSPSLAKLLHPEDLSISPPIIINAPSEFTVASGSKAKSKSDPKRSHSPTLIIDSLTEFTIASTSKLQRSLPPSPPPAPPPAPSRDNLEPLSAYSCPICFFPPTNATLTPCGHVCCGACLFTAVKTMAQRGVMAGERGVPKCPVCRAQIPGWDGRGGGVIGLKVRAVFSL